MVSFHVVYYVMCVLSFDLQSSQVKLLTSLTNLHSKSARRRLGGGHQEQEVSSEKEDKLTGLILRQRQLQKFMLSYNSPVSV